MSPPAPTEPPRDRLVWAWVRYATWCPCGARLGELHECDIRTVTMDGERMMPTAEPPP